VNSGASVVVSGILSQDETDPYVAVILTLQEIEIEPSPQLKLDKLGLAFREVERILLDTKHDLSADVKWPVIHYVVFKAELQHLYSTVMYLNNYFQGYQFGGERMERVSLHIAELENAANYILHDLMSQTQEGQEGEDLRRNRG